jgi:hypothetical protein
MKRTIKLARIYIVLQWDTFAVASTSGTSTQEMVRDVMGSMVTCNLLTDV